MVKITTIIKLFKKKIGLKGKDNTLIKLIDTAKYYHHLESNV